MAVQITEYCQQAPCECTTVGRVTANSVFILRISNIGKDLNIKLVVLHEGIQKVRGVISRQKLFRILRDTVDGTCGVVKWSCEGKTLFIQQGIDPEKRNMQAILLAKLQQKQQFFICTFE